MEDTASKQTIALAAIDKALFILRDLRVRDGDVREGEPTLFPLPDPYAEALRQTAIAYLSASQEVEKTGDEGTATEFAFKGVKKLVEAVCFESAGSAAKSVMETLLQSAAELDCDITFRFADTQPQRHITVMVPDLAYIGQA